MKNRQLLLLCITIMIFMTACGNNKEQPVNTPKTSISRFEVDSNTIKQEDESLWKSLKEQQEIKEQQENEDDSYEYISDEHVGELTIKNDTETQPNIKQPSDSSTEEPSDIEQPSDTEEPEGNIEEPEGNIEEPEGNIEEPEGNIEEPSDNVDETHMDTNIELENGEYTIVGNDIIYNGITFENLYDSINEVITQSPYDADTIIKFLISTYKVDTDKVFTSGGLETELSEGEDGDTSESIHEQFINSSDNYKRLCEKYNDKAIWRLTMYTYGYNDVAQIVGCKSFIAIIGTDEDIEVDVSDFE